MKFSFIVPAYNEEGYLGRCIESIKNQKTKDYEIVVSYSPSRDNTLDIAKKHGVKIVYVPRCYPGKARNVAAKKAKGDYLVFMDADVQIPKNFLKVTEKLLERGAAAVGYGMKPMENDPEIMSYFRHFFNPLNRYAKNLSCCYTVKKPVFAAVGGYDEKREVGEDTEISVRLSRIGKIVFASGVVPKVSLRRFHKLGRAKTLGIYVSWFILGFILGARARYFHVSDVERGSVT